MAPRHTLVRERVSEMQANLPRYLEAFEARNPFSRYGQLECHIRTIKLLRQLGSPARAIAEPEFTASLHRTLQAWNMDSRGAKLKPLAEFRAALAAKAGEISAIADRDLRDCTDPVGLADQIWALIQDLDVSLNQSKLVVGTKTLHHLLPSLVPPMDRAYTRVFFKWYGQTFQYQQAAFLKDVLPFFVDIARAVDLPSYVTGRGWRTSTTKLLDNAVVGYCIEKQLRLP